MNPLATEARALCQGATEGPWRAGRSDMGTYVDGYESKWIYAGEPTGKSKYLAVSSGYEIKEWDEVMANAHLIARSRTLIPEMADEIERLEKELSFERNKSRLTRPIVLDGQSAENFSHVIELGELREENERLSAALKLAQALHADRKSEIDRMKEEALEKATEVMEAEGNFNGTDTGFVMSRAICCTGETWPSPRRKKKLMDRLTKKYAGGYGLVKVRDNEQDLESPYPNTLRACFESWQRLAAYEDTGLMPEDIMRLDATARCNANMHARLSERLLKQEERTHKARCQRDKARAEAEQWRNAFSTAEAISIDLAENLKYMTNEASQYHADIEAGRLVSLPNELIAPYELNERYWVCGWDADDCTLTIQDRALKSKAEARAALEGEDLT
ncbi:MAG: hypothetical protein PHS57_06220 [Alphaproteobacteria bacterium]|nr:hypothetical protein [Alphaproteobacteria bacterium]